jgi:hypothetical protein
VRRILLQRRISQSHERTTIAQRLSTVVVGYRKRRSFPAGPSQVLARAPQAPTYRYAFHCRVEVPARKQLLSFLAKARQRASPPGQLATSLLSAAIACRSCLLARYVVLERSAASPPCSLAGRLVLARSLRSQLCQLTRALPRCMSA